MKLGDRPWAPDLVINFPSREICSTPSSESCVPLWQYKFLLRALPCRGDSVILTFPVPPLTIEQVLRDIDTKIEYGSKLLRKISENWEVLARRN